MSASMASEVREILAHADSEATLRKQLIALCEIHEKENPYDDDLYEFGVAVKAARRKRWTMPNEHEHGTYAQAEIEFKALQRLPSTDVKIVKRPKTGQWVDA